MGGGSLTGLGKSPLYFVRFLPQTPILLFKGQKVVRGLLGARVFQ